MKVRQLQSELWLPQEVAEIFPFFADAANLEVLTPPWLKFQILSPRPLEMRVGTLIDYRLRVRGFPLRWQSEITVWEPMHRFVDEQRRGPYRLWRHEHEFVERGGGTVIRDKVEYAIPFDLLTHRWLVRPDIERIFDFRERKMRELFPAWKPETKAETFRSSADPLELQSRFASSVLDQSDAFRFKREGLRAPRCAKQSPPCHNPC